MAHFYLSTEYLKFESISAVKSANILLCKNSWMQDPRCQHEYLNSIMCMIGISTGEENESEKHL